MISFVWSSQHPFLAGSGGSENFTVGQVRELNRRGLPARVITLGHRATDSRRDFPDVDFVAMDSPRKLSRLDDTIVFVHYPQAVSTKRTAYVIIHCPPISLGAVNPLFNFSALRGKHLITTSEYSADMWSDYLSGHPPVDVVYPFAEESFGLAKRRPWRAADPVRILFAGRLTPDKGVYTLLAALHMPEMMHLRYTLTATESGTHMPEGRVLRPVMAAHPWVNLIPARKTASDMAQLMAEHDIVVMPTTSLFWHETFGIVSVEAQHAGCRVVAASSGGLPESDCGNLLLVKPDDPTALSQGIARAATLGSVSPARRRAAARRFTASQSVDQLLRVMSARQARVLSVQRSQLPKIPLTSNKQAARKTKLSYT